jgi:holin (3TMs family)
MGIAKNLMGLIFGGKSNIIVETVGAFRPNAEAQDARGAQIQTAAMMQMASEFRENRNWFDSLIDGLNRLPRPLMAFGILGLMAAAMSDPLWFAARMKGVALVPEPLWWLMGVIVSFYFGSRYGEKTQNFASSMSAGMARAAAVTLSNEREAREPPPGPVRREPNAALDAMLAAE